MSHLHLETVHRFPLFHCRQAGFLSTPPFRFLLLPDKYSPDNNESAMINILMSEKMHCTAHCHDYTLPYCTPEWTFVRSHHKNISTFLLISSVDSNIHRLLWQYHVHLYSSCSHHSHQLTLYLSGYPPLPRHF